MSIKEMMESLSFPGEAESYLLQVRSALPEGVFAHCRDLMLVCKEPIFTPLLKEISEKYNIPLYVIHLLYLLECAENLREVYREQGYSQELFTESMMDLSYQVRECHAAYGIWGYDVLSWAPCFFQLRRFKLGRLQYEGSLWLKDTIPGVVEKGERIHRMHIPACGPCTMDSVIDSLKKAYEFYRIGETNSKLLKVACSSWILHPPIFPVFAEGSNLDAFRRLFYLAGTKARGYATSRLIFGKELQEPVDWDSLPQKTGLQRRLLQYLKNGGEMGYGAGILIFDGEKVLLPPEQ